MARRVDVPDKFMTGPFRVVDAERAGLSRVFLAGPNFRAPFPGCARIPCHIPDTFRVRCEAASLILPHDAAFSHRTAAQLCELPRVRMLLISAGLPCPENIVDVFDNAGSWIARSDLSYPHLKIAIEYDGDHHRTEKHQWRRDRARDESLRHAGWIVITLTADDVFKHPRRTVERVTHYYRMRSAAEKL